MSKIAFSPISSTNKTGVLIVNLGSPDEPTPTAVRHYLKQFLSDPRVVHTNRLLWWCMLNLVILTIRPKPVAKAYASVWTKNGSPLIVISKKQSDAIAKLLNQQFGSNIQTELAMTYGNPSIPDAIKSFHNAGINNILVLNMYPQFSYTTTAAVSDAIKTELKKLAYQPNLISINDYFDHPDYISALCNSIKQQWANQKRAQLLMFSFHGIPQSYVDKGDPYYDQCLVTAQLIAKQLKLQDKDWRVVFQSRFGREPWLQPYCDKTLQSLPAEGITSVDILCPGFSADCLETIEEIQHENKNYFFESGGKTFNYISCLNDNKEHIDALTNIINQYLVKPNA